MNIQVEFDVRATNLYSQGRNGLAKTVAVRLWDIGHGGVAIEPITSRGSAQNCFIELTEEAMDELAARYLAARGLFVGEEMLNAVLITLKGMGN